MGSLSGDVRSTPGRTFVCFCQSSNPEVNEAQLCTAVGLMFSRFVIFLSAFGLVLQLFISRMQFLLHKTNI